MTVPEARRRCAYCAHPDPSQVFFGTQCAHGAQPLAGTPQVETCSILQHSDLPTHLPIAILTQKMQTISIYNSKNISIMYDC